MQPGEFHLDLLQSGIFSDSQTEELLTARVGQIFGPQIVESRLKDYPSIVDVMN